MKKIFTAAATATLAIGLIGCGANGSTEPVVGDHAATSTTSKQSATSSSETTTRSSEAPTSSDTTVPIETEAYTAPTPANEAPAAAPPRPPFMSAEDYDPYGPPKFVQCWERNAAVMSDGSIVTDTVNCAPTPAPAPAQSNLYDNPPRTDGCVGPAATCGYYDEAGNPVWFDKMTGETSPRYFDEFGNPTMESN